MQIDQRPNVGDECAEFVRIPVLDITSYEAAAKLLAVLAYPDDKKARTRFEHAAYFKIIEHLSKHPGWKNSNQWLRPDYLLLDRKMAETEYKRGIRLIRYSRMIAAKMAAPTDCCFFAFEKGRDSRGAGGKLAEYGYFAPTSAELIAEVSMDLDRLRKKDTTANKGNITERCWTPSKPVLHLCLALQSIFNAGDEMTYLDLPFETLFNDPGMIMIVINKARYYRNFTSGIFDIPRSQQIDLDWR